MTGQFRYALPRDMDSVVPLPKPTTTKRLDRPSAHGIEGRTPPDFLKMAKRTTIKPDAPFVPAHVSFLPGSTRPGFISQLARNEASIRFPTSAVRRGIR